MWYGESCVHWTNGGNAFGRRILRWKRSSIGPLLFAWHALSRCKTLTFWSGDGGAGGVTSLLGGVIFESLCSVNLWRAAGQRHGEEDGGLPEDSSFLCP